MSIIDSTVHRQMEYLASVVTKIEDEMIDPIDYGQLKGKVDAFEAKLTAIEQKVDKLVRLASEGQGGIRALWFAGSVVAGVLGWIGADKLFR